MTTPTQAEAIRILTEVAELSPDVRLGQLFAHLGFLGEDRTQRGLWDIEDEQLLAVLRDHRQELTDRRTVSTDGLPRVAGTTVPMREPAAVGWQLAIDTYIAKASG